MSAQSAINAMVERFQSIGRDLMTEVERRLARLPRGDQSGWYYVESVGTLLADGRPTAVIKPKNAEVGAGNKALGPFPCLRSYSPVVGHRVLVRWVCGDRADGVIEG